MSDERAASSPLTYAGAGVDISAGQRAVELIRPLVASTARSGVINTARDFSCAIVTAECDLLTAVESYPIHVLGGADLMTRAMLDIHPDVKPGDAFLHNSPYHGNTHAADHTILVPVFD